MLENLKRIPGRAVKRFTHTPFPNAKPIIESLAHSLMRNLKKDLRLLEHSLDGPSSTRELHLSINNLTNIYVVFQKLCNTKDWIGAETAFPLIDDAIAQTTLLLRSGDVSVSIDAINIVTRTLNFLFNAKQGVKQVFYIITPFEIANLPPEMKLPTLIPSELSTTRETPEMVLSSAMIFQLRQSLFPAERMIVGAGRRTKGTISVDALFDVTGVASAGGVQAEPDRLGQALIAMSESGTYFGLWVHSHPGLGPEATHPSGIDLRQHADWLKDYSADLVSAIMVKDRYIRFWGTAVESGRIVVKIDGSGIGLISAKDNIYRLEA